VIEDLEKIALWIDTASTSASSSRDGRHTVPRTSGSWFYVFGSGTTGLLHDPSRHRYLPALVYVPSSGQAYSSLEYLNYQQQLGGFCAPCTTGFKLHGRDHAPHHGPGLLFGAFKIPSRDDMDFRGRTLTLHSRMASRARSCVSIRMHLGLGMGGHGRTRAIAGRQNCSTCARRADHRRPGKTLSRFSPCTSRHSGHILAIVSLHAQACAHEGDQRIPGSGKQVKKETYARSTSELKKSGVPFFQRRLARTDLQTVSVLLGIVFCAPLRPRRRLGRRPESYTDQHGRRSLISFSSGSTACCL